MCVLGLNHHASSTRHQHSTTLYQCMYMYTSASLHVCAPVVTAAATITVLYCCSIHAGHVLCVDRLSVYAPGHLLVNRYYASPITWEHISDKLLIIVLSV